jgi:hypothetical protein
VSQVVFDVIIIALTVRKTLDSWNEMRRNRFRILGLSDLMFRDGV